MRSLDSRPTAGFPVWELIRKTIREIRHQNNAIGKKYIQRTGKWSSENVDRPNMLSLHSWFSVFQLSSGLFNVRNALSNLQEQVFLIPSLWPQKNMRRTSWDLRCKVLGGVSTFIHVWGFHVEVGRTRRTTKEHQEALSMIFMVGVYLDKAPSITLLITCNFSSTHLVWQRDQWKLENLLIFSHLTSSFANKCCQSLLNPTNWWKANWEAKLHHARSSSMLATSRSLEHQLALLFPWKKMFWMFRPLVWFQVTRALFVIFSILFKFFSLRNCSTKQLLCPLVSLGVLWWTSEDKISWLVCHKLVLRLILSCALWGFPPSVAGLEGLLVVPKQNIDMEVYDVSNKSQKHHWVSCKPWLSGSRHSISTLSCCTADVKHDYVAHHRSL